MERYTCPRELLPVIESALAAEGYVLEAPLQRAVGRSRITVMTRGGVVISLHEDMAHDMADIHVYRDQESVGPTVFEKLPRLIPAPLSRPRGARRATDQDDPGRSLRERALGESDT